MTTATVYKLVYEPAFSRLTGKPLPTDTTLIMEDLPRRNADGRLEAVGAWFKSLPTAGR